MIGRLEESVCGKTDDSTLATIYNRILPATIHWLEKIADSKPKYASLVRLGARSYGHCESLHGFSLLSSRVENYYFMSDRLAGINPATDLPLGQYAETARLKYLDSLQRYCAYIWVYEFKNLEVSESSPRCDCTTDGMLFGLVSRCLLRLRSCS